ncbi:MAG: relaxase/mobilization nuclease domain-containing protein [Bacteroidota bacterium]
MILKGSTIASVQHARRFAQHLVKEENTLIEVAGSDGSQQHQDLYDDLVDMHLLTRLTRGKTGIFHVAINPQVGETMNHDQWDRAIAHIEEEFGLEGQLRLQVYHEKKERAHLHVFWSLVDLEQGKLIQIRYFKRRLQRRATQMEQEFGHAITRRTTSKRSLEITNADRMQQARTGKDSGQRKRRITALWEQANSAEHFIQALRLRGFDLIQGDRCKYALIDRAGEVYNLVRELPKQVKLKDVDGKLQEHYKSLQTLQEATEEREHKLGRQLERLRERGERQRER